MSPDIPPLAVDRIFDSLVIAKPTTPVQYLNSCGHFCRFRRRLCCACFYPSRTHDCRLCQREEHP